MPAVQVTSLVLNQNTNSLLAGTYGRSVYELFLDAAETAPPSLLTQGSIIGLSGLNSWGGPVVVSNLETPTSTPTTAVYFATEGTQNLPNGLSAGEITFGGQISDQTTGNAPTINKVGVGDIVFAPPAGVGDIYAGNTIIQEGSLVVDNALALGGTDTLAVAPANSTIVESGGAWSCAPASTPNRSRCSATASISTATLPARCAATAAPTPIPATSRWAWGPVLLRPTSSGPTAAAR